jgi:hypothetical protein
MWSLSKTVHPQEFPVASSSCGCRWVRGKICCEVLTQTGFEVRALVRRPDAHGDLAVWLTAAAEKLDLHSPIRSDNLLGIKHARWFDPQPDMERIGIQPLSFAESLALVKKYRSPLRTA